MTQPDFDFTAPTEKRPHKRVRESSKAVYAIGRAKFVGRQAKALRWLAAYWNHYNQSPTSAELAVFSYLPGGCFECHKLLVRRGLSDLHRTGIIEHVPPRSLHVCRVTKRCADRWRVREIGSEESR